MFAFVRQKRGIVLSMVVLLALLLGVGIFLYFKNNAVKQEAVAEPIDTVTLATVSELAHTQSFSTVGTVASVSQAELQTETGGRVTSVPVSLGSHVAAGAVIATLENSVQQAALVQAEGSYDAARAAAASSNVGVGASENSRNSAYTSAIDTYRKAYITIDSTLHSDIDDVYTNKNGIYNGLLIDGRGMAPELNATRNDLETALAAWKTRTDTITKDTSLDYLADAIAYTQRVEDLAQQLNNLVDQQDVTSSFSADDKAALQSELSGDRTTLNTSLQSLSGARTAIIAAEKAYEQASIAGSGTDASAAAAQVKIAAGALSAAKANYEKTIVRSPISGTVNSLYLKEGDYAAPSQAAAVIANNNGLEITTAVGESEAQKLSVGDTVSIEGNATGTITAIAPALDQKTGKIEVKVSVAEGSSLINGATVKVTFTDKTAIAGNAATFTIPLTALKITSSGPIAFTVKDDQTLSPISVTIGQIEGDTVEVESGLTPDSLIVTDARGLKEGQKVSVSSN